MKVEERIKNSRSLAFIGRHKEIISLYVIALTVFNAWFFSTGILTHSDTHHRFQETLKEFFALPSVLQQMRLDTVNMILPFYPIYLLIGGLAQIFNYQVIERLVLLWPPILTIIASSYLYSKRLFDSKKAGFIGSIVYTYNTYFLYLGIIGHTFLMMGIALIPAMLILFENLLAKKDAKSVFSFSLVGMIMCFFEFRIFYILFWILALYFLFEATVFNKWNTRLILRKALVTGLAYIIIAIGNLYWVLPMYNTGSITDNPLFSRGLFGNKFFNIFHAFTLHHSWWGGEDFTLFIENAVPVHLYLLPILAFLGYYIHRKNSKILFFFLISIIGILLTKQTDAPFENLYQWLYSSIPGFNAFREASKFYSIIALGYSVLIAGLFINLKKYFNNPYSNLNTTLIIAIAISSIFLINGLPLATRNIERMFKEKTIPQDYVVLKDYITNENAEYATLWVPNVSRWAYYSSRNPLIRMNEFLDNVWIPSEPESQTIPKKKEWWQVNFSQVSQDEYFAETLNKANVKYLVVPIKDILNDDNFFDDIEKFTKLDREDYIELLRKSQYFKEIQIGATEVVVFENMKFTGGKYIFATDKVVATSDENRSDKYLFSKSTGSKSFITVKPIQNEYFTDLNMLLEKFDIQNTLKTRQVKVDIQNPSYKNLYIFQNMGKYNIDIVKSENDIYRIIANNDLSKLLSSKLNDTDIILDSFTAKDSETLYLLINNYPYKIDLTSPRQRLLSNSEIRSIGILKPGSENIITNPSFEKGGWKDKVYDCNQYDTNGNISMNLSTDSSDGKSSIVLSSTRHIACTWITFEVKNGSPYYILSFDYKSANAPYAGYFLGFDDKDKTYKSDIITILSRDKWETLQEIITAPNESEKATLYIYAYEEDGENPNTVLYDNFKLTPMTLVKNVNTSGLADTKYSKTDLPQQQELTIDLNLDQFISSKNLALNGSFEEGLWNNKVSNCGGTEGEGYINSRLSPDSAFEGNYSLELVAKNRIACTYNTFDTPKTDELILSFEYTTSNAKEAGYFVQFNDDPNTRFIERISIDQQNDLNKWKNFSKRLQIPAGASEIKVYFYSFADSDKSTTVFTNYDNLRIFSYQSLNDSLYVMGKPTIEMSVPAITYQNIDPTTKTISIDNATKPFILVTKFLYQDKWELQVRKDVMGNFDQIQALYRPYDKISEDKHFKVDSAFNGWYIDPVSVCENNSSCKRNGDGSFSFNVVLDYQPKRWAYLGSLITAITFFIILSLVITYNFSKISSIAIDRIIHILSFLKESLITISKKDFYTTTLEINIGRFKQIFLIILSLVSIYFSLQVLAPFIIVAISISFFSIFFSVLSTKGSLKYSIVELVIAFVILGFSQNSSLYSSTNIESLLAKTLLIHFLINSLTYVVFDIFQNISSKMDRKTQEYIHIPRRHTNISKSKIEP